MESRRRRVFEELHSAILDGSIKRGEPIPERAFALRMSASRVPVREALLQLEGRGLVRLIEGRGAFVRSFTIEEIRDLHDVRETLEGRAARAAAGRMDKYQLADFETEFRSLLSTGNAVDMLEVSNCGRRFHEAIANACANKVLSDLIHRIREQIELSRVLFYDQASNAVLRGGVRAHQQILKALKKCDGTAAEGLMRRHIAERNPVRIELVKNHQDSRVRGAIKYEDH